MSRVNAYYLSFFRARIDKDQFAFHHKISPHEVGRWLSGGSPSQRLSDAVIAEMHRLGVKNVPPEGVGLSLGEFSLLIPRLARSEAVMIVDGDQDCKHNVEDYFTSEAPVHVVVVGNSLTCEHKWKDESNSSLKTFVTAGSSASQASDLVISVLIGMLHAGLSLSTKISVASGDDFALTVTYALNSFPRSFVRIDCQSESPMAHLIRVMARDNDVLMASLGVVNRFTRSGNAVVRELGSSGSDYKNIVAGSITVRHVTIEKQRAECEENSSFAGELRQRIKRGLRLMDLGKIATKYGINNNRACEWYWGRRPCMPGAIFAYRRELGEL